MVDFTNRRKVKLPQITKEKYGFVMNSEDYHDV